MEEMNGRECECLMAIRDTVKGKNERKDYLRERERKEKEIERKEVVVGVLRAKCDLLKFQVGTRSHLPFFLLYSLSLLYFLSSFLLLLLLSLSYRAKNQDRDRDF